MYNYAINFEQYNEPGLAINCRDLPELHGWGEDDRHCLSQGIDAIETVLSLYVDRREAIPKATPPLEREHVIHLPAVTVAKITLWNEMMARDMRKADLCRLLGLAQTQGDRLVDFLHTSKMEAVEAALRALNVKLRVTQEVIADPLDIWISLPESRISSGFTIRQLVQAFGENRELVVGKDNANLDEIKNYSLDFILRGFTNEASRNTRQSTVPVIDALVATGVFRRSRMIDPATSREVDSLALV